MLLQVLAVRCHRHGLVAAAVLPLQLRLCRRRAPAAVVEDAVLAPPAEAEHHAIQVGLALLVACCQLRRAQQFVHVPVRSVEDVTVRGIVPVAAVSRRRRRRRRDLHIVLQLLHTVLRKSSCQLSRRWLLLRCRRGRVVLRGGEEESGDRHEEEEEGGQQDQQAATGPQSLHLSIDRLTAARQKASATTRPQRQRRSVPAAAASPPQQLRAGAARVSFCHDALSCRAVCRQTVLVDRSDGGDLSIWSPGGCALT